MLKCSIKINFHYLWLTLPPWKNFICWIGQSQTNSSPWSISITTTVELPFLNMLSHHLLIPFTVTQLSRTFTPKFYRFHQTCGFSNYTQICYIAIGTLFLLQLAQWSWPPPPSFVTFHNIVVLTWLGGDPQYGVWSDLEPDFSFSMRRWRRLVSLAQS